MGESVAQFIVPMAEEIDQYNEPLLAGPSSLSEQTPSRDLHHLPKKLKAMHPKKLGAPSFNSHYR